MGGEESIKKYYDQRYRLFSKFDLGILLDKESWFSVRIAGVMYSEVRCAHGAPVCVCSF